MLQITQSEQGQQLFVSFSGELDHHAARQAIDQTEDLLALYPGDGMVLDLSRLTFMDSSGLAVAMHILRSCSHGGRTFSIRGTPPQAMRVFEAAGLPKMISFEKGGSVHAADTQPNESEV